jgi:hypothetical protein
MNTVNRIAGLKNFGALCAFSALAFLGTQEAQAAPVRLACTFDAGAGVAAGQRTWTYDLEAHTVDGHRAGEKVPTVGNAYNQYFITDTLIGFSTSSGVRHTISLTDGRYTAYGANGSVHWTGACSVAK